MAGKPVGGQSVNEAQNGGKKMERLTNKAWQNFDPWECCGQDKYCQRGCHDPGGCTKGCIVPRLYARLGAYEDTKLTPEEIDMDHEAAETLRQLCRGYDLGRLVNLAEADKSGCVVVRPYKIDAAVYVLVKDEAVFYPETNGWYIGKETIGAITQDGFYLGDPEEGSFEPNDEIGKTVFLTCEEAEAALEAMKDAK